MYCLEAYEFWKNDGLFGLTMRMEPEALTDPNEIEEQFYRNL